MNRSSLFERPEMPYAKTSGEDPAEMIGTDSYFDAAHAIVGQQLLDQRNDQGHWVGRLSTSALSTATAVSALSLYRKHSLDRGLSDRGLSERAVSDGAEQDGSLANVWDPTRLQSLIRGGVTYLLQAQNEDGGWGDTDKSYSNIATTYLGWAALELATSLPDDELSLSAVQNAVKLAKSRIDQWGGIAALRARYGRDKTFVVPILTNCALAGIVDWREVVALPFEAAWVPQKYYRFLRLPVVSYAVPALVAIGQAKYFHHPPIWPLRWLRRKAVEPTMRVLLRMQPSSGGYLEAAPLTSFVAMSLAATGRADHPVTRNAIRFLVDSVLSDGSWPIDTNLATWVTTLSINALAAGPDLWLDFDDNGPAEPGSGANPSHRTGSWNAGLTSANESVNGNSDGASVMADWSLMPESGWQWLVDCQYQQPHPFTGADPGAWGWTNLSGSVPDADDTPGALLALFVAHRLSGRQRIRFSQTDLRGRARAGVLWLLDLQNRDGGWPTFCRGWGRLPFDRSGVDLTAHVMRAFVCWYPAMDAALQIRMQKALLRGWDYIARSQRPDGSWLPLWFGNQDREDDENPIYGTAKTVVGLCDLWQHFHGMSKGNRPYRLPNRIRSTIRQGVVCLGQLQNEDGGWGGGPSIKEYVSRQGVAHEYTSSIEETGLAVEALSHWLLTCRNEEEKVETAQGGELFHQVLGQTRAGVAFLCQRIHNNEHRNSWPIGFYFAKLWYHEESYPLVFSVAALSRWKAVKTPQVEASAGGYRHRSHSLEGNASQ